jgi:hypothetical protein
LRGARVRFLRNIRGKESAARDVARRFTMSYKNILVSVEDGVAVVKLDRPESLKA